MHLACRGLVTCICVSIVNARYPLARNIASPRCFMLCFNSMLERPYIFVYFQMYTRYVCIYVCTRSEIEDIVESHLCKHCDPSIRRNYGFSMLISLQIYIYIYIYVYIPGLLYIL